MQQKHSKNQNGFTMIELIIVIVILGILAAFAVPRFIDIKRNAKIATLKGVQGALRSAVIQVQSAAVISGLKPQASNPSGGGNDQTSMVIHTNLGSFEVDWRNLCPESRAELLDQLTTLNFVDLHSGSEQLQTRITNQSTWVGYALPPEECYVVYDSFACTVTIADADC